MSHFITEEIDQLLDCKHAQNMFIVSSNKDKQLLWACARELQIEPPCINIRSFDHDVYEPARGRPEFNGIPTTVINFLMDEGRNFLVRE